MGDRQLTDDNLAYNYTRTNTIYFTYFQLSERKQNDNNTYARESSP